MLTIQEHYNSFKMVAIDPGLNNTGIAIFTISLFPFQITHIEAFTLKSERLVDDSMLDDDDFMERLHKRYMMGNSLRRILEAHNPSSVVSESPFFDRRKPGSFAVLTEVLTELYDTVVQFNPLIRFSMKAPQLVKKTLGVAGIKGKEVVKEAMAKVEEIVSVVEGSFDHLDEHAIDAIGVGYTWFTEERKLNKQESKDA